MLPNMLKVQSRRAFARPRTLIFLSLVAVALYWTLITSSSVSEHVVRWQDGAMGYLQHPLGGEEEVNGQASESSAESKTVVVETDLNGGDVPFLNNDIPSKHPHVPQPPNPDQPPPQYQDQEVVVVVVEEDEPPKTPEELEREEREREKEKYENDMKAEYELEWKQVGQHSGAGALYGNTLATLVDQDTRSPEHAVHLKPSSQRKAFTSDVPYIYNPYPRYNSKDWLESHERYEPCTGPFGQNVEDITVFRGRPHDFPAPGFGSHDVLNMDGNVCFERETRLGPYGYSEINQGHVTDTKWNVINWGQLQDECAVKNSARYNMNGTANRFLGKVYQNEQLEKLPGATGPLEILEQLKNDQQDPSAKAGKDRQKSAESATSSSYKGPSMRRRRGMAGNQFEKPENRSATGKPKHEERTAILLRTYTGKKYSENDKENIRAMVTELSLRTGGQYQVFLLVHVKDPALMIWEDENTYQWVLQTEVPSEFRDMAVLWNDEIVQSMYPKLDPKSAATVHYAQWLSVQKFSMEFPEFDYIWNWEMDVRITGQMFDFVEKLGQFGKKQPRRGLWERNERYYIPSFHGDYDTSFRLDTERRTRRSQIWYPPSLPFVSPVGPKPPVSKPDLDDYEWGVGEEADLITVAPIVDSVQSSWIGGHDVWGYSDGSHDSDTIPRRMTIVTQQRISKKLLDIMHVENLRGNHVSSEQTCQTVSLLHGLKAVYAPNPIWFDRPWNGSSLAKWFNGGVRGESGGVRSAMGWGREGRYQGSTWYYRAGPPQRVYNNWMGYEDTELGGDDWEEVHGRPCVPAMLLHPIKDVKPTEPGYHSESKLPFG